MIFTFGKIPPSKLLDTKQGGWTPLREPRSVVFVIQVLLLSIPFLVPAVAILPEIKGLRNEPFGILVLLLFFLLITPIHEMIHASVYPGGVFSKHLIMGAWMSRGLCYVVYDSPLSRNRILVMLSAPFIILSTLLMTVICFATPIWRLVGVLFLLVHTAMCIGDVITFVRLIKQAPVDSLIHNNGWTTYWKSLPK